ncbi:MAG: YkgJ family cysteine cluster protein [bacterium]
MLLEFLKTKKVSFFWVYFFYYAYVVQLSVIRSKRLEGFLWDCFKVTYFYIAGGCKHSGLCCSSLHLYSHSKPIKTLSEFNKKCQKDRSYRCFVPFKKAAGALLFRCKCLTASNFCSNYDNRPLICQQYPYSLFMSSDFIYADCGYYVAIKASFLRVRSSGLKKRISSVLILNQQQL